MSRSLNRGANNGAAKLRAADVLAIRRRRAAGESRRVLATEFDVGIYTIRDIVEGRTWAWLEEETVG